MWTMLWTTLAACVTLSAAMCTLPPFTSTEEGVENELQRLVEEDYPEEGISGLEITRGHQLKASLGDRDSVTGRECYGDPPVKEVKGNLGCLDLFWEYQPSLGEPYTAFAERNECKYNIIFDNCSYGPKPKGDLEYYESEHDHQQGDDCPDSETAFVNETVTNDVDALVDGNPNTIWAREIVTNDPIEIKLDLGREMEVYALAIELETVVVKLTISLERDGEIVPVVSLQQEPCEEEVYREEREGCAECEQNYEERPASICQKWHQALRRVLTVSWGFSWNSVHDLRADKVLLTLQDERTSGPYETNYYIIRDIKLAARDPKVETTYAPPTEPPRTTYPPQTEPPRTTYPPQTEPPTTYPPQTEPPRTTYRERRTRPPTSRPVTEKARQTDYPSTARARRTRPPTTPRSQTQRPGAKSWGNDKPTLDIASWRESMKASMNDMKDEIRSGFGPRAWGR